MSNWPQDLTEVGTIPEHMQAQTLRQYRYGDPVNAFKMERIPVPDIEEDEVLLAVVSAGLNYNNVWAALGYPIDLIQLIGQENFHIAGSDAAGIVYKVGSKVKGLKVGDEVVVAPLIIDPKDPYILSGGDEILAPSIKAWGYETNWGSFAQFCKVKEFQCLPKPSTLSWTEASTCLLSAGTVYRMLTYHKPHNIKPGDVVAIWGGSGGLGVMAIQICLMFGAQPVCIVSNDERKAFCESMGAKAVLRNGMDHWGPLPKNATQPEGQDAWRQEAKKLFKQLLQVTGGKAPRIVLEHPGESTLPTSLYICDKGGMVVTCAGTTGYLGTFDLRYLWLAQKRIQGSHGASLKEFETVNKMFEDGKLVPVVSEEFNFDELPHALQLMKENKHKPGSMAIKIGNI